MSFPENSVLDAFNRANQNLDVSANWSLDVWNTSGAGGLQISSQEVTNSIEEASTGWWDATSFSANQEVFATLNTLPSDGQAVWLYARVSNPGEEEVEGYAAKFLYSSEGSTVGFYRVVGGGGVTQIDSSTAVSQLSGGEQLGLRVYGSELCAFIDGDKQATVTDTNFTRAGYIGFAIDDNTAAMDDFGGGAATEVCTCTAVTAVAVTSRPCGVIATNYTYTATLTPTNATTPTYLWSTDGLQSGQGTASAVYKWLATDSGVKTVTATVTDCTPTVHTATSTTIISNDDFRQDIYDIVSAVSDLGNVYKYRRWNVMDYEFLTRFKATIDGATQLRGVDMEVGTFTATLVEFRGTGRDTELRTWSVYVNLYVGWNDGEESEITAQTLATNIADALDAAEVLHSGCHYYECKPAQLVQADPIRYNDELTHYRRLQIDITIVEQGAA